MKRSSGPRKAANLPESVHRQLNMYALAAGAAGVSMLGSAQPADAKIVYTRADKVIVGVFDLDLNHDGITDFVFGTRIGSTESTVGGYLRVAGYVSDNSIVTTHRGYDAAALRAGVRIGGNLDAGETISPPKYGGPIMASFRRLCFQCKTYFAGPWANGGKGVRNRYLGLKFVIKGKVHYGWARLNVEPHSITATLTGYAYQTIPGKPIITGQTKGTDEIDDNIGQANPAALTVPTPEPATLGALALGAPGLSIWRREDSVAATPERN